MRGPETSDLTLEDLSSSIDLVREMIELYGYDADDPPAIIYAAATLLRQTQRQFADLHYFIAEKLGDLEITVPRTSAFYFDRICSQHPKFLDVKIIPKSGNQSNKKVEKNEPETDPEKIASYKSSIETLLGSMAPEIRDQVVSEFAEETGANIRLHAKCEQVDALNKKLIAANTDLRVELEGKRISNYSEENNKGVSHG